MGPHTHFGEGFHKNWPHHHHSHHRLLWLHWILYYHCSHGQIVHLHFWYSLLRRVERHGLLEIVQYLTPYQLSRGAVALVNASLCNLQRVIIMCTVRICTWLFFMFWRCSRYILSDLLGDKSVLQRMKRVAAQWLHDFSRAQKYAFNYLSPAISICKEVLLQMGITPLTFDGYAIKSVKLSSSQVWSVGELGWSSCHGLRLSLNQAGRNLLKRMHLQQTWAFIFRRQGKKSLPCFAEACAISRLSLMHLLNFHPCTRAVFFRLRPQGTVLYKT